MAPEVGKYYRDNKSKMTYQVTALGKHFETLEDMVFYRGDFDRTQCEWLARPAAMWDENFYVLDDEYQERRKDEDIRQHRAKNLLLELGIDHPRCGFYVSAGWFPIVERALRQMVTAGWNKHLNQVKQKFCGLRIYVDEATDVVHGIIREAEDMCEKSCEDCGLPHGLQVPRSGVALCQVCRGNEEPDPPVKMKRYKKLHVDFMGSKKDGDE